jgi:nitrate reductase gamma subunit
LAWNRNFQDPALYGNRRLIENAISWVAAHPVMISVPEKPERDLGLSLSEESLGEVARYVLLYMPGSVALIGAFVLLRRRNVEKRSRVAREAKG